MSGETYITAVGRVTADPELRILPNGSAVASFKVAVNPRKFNKQTNEWASKPAKFWQCQAWNTGKQTLADNVIEAVQKGTSVIVYGELETREWETNEGEKRSADQLRVISVGKDLTWHHGNSAPQSAGGYAQLASAPTSGRGAHPRPPAAAGVRPPTTSKSTSSQSTPCRLPSIPCDRRQPAKSQEKSCLFPRSPFARPSPCRPSVSVPPSRISAPAATTRSRRPGNAGGAPNEPPVRHHPGEPGRPAPQRARPDRVRRPAPRPLPGAHRSREEGRRSGVREAARKNRIKTIAKIQKQERPTPPEEFRADAEAAYRKSMRLFPDNAHEGGRRLNAVLREVTKGQGYGARKAAA